MINSVIIAISLLNLYSERYFIDNLSIEEELLRSDYEITGLIVDYTQTKMGRDFYDFFYQKWTATEDIPALSVIISEIPVPTSATGTRITVSVEDNVVFENFLQSRLEIIEANVDAAIERTKVFIDNYEAIQMQLQGDDMMGTGIF